MASGAKSQRDPQTLERYWSVYRGINDRGGRGADAASLRRGEDYITAMVPSGLPIADRLRCAIDVCRSQLPDRDASGAESYIEVPVAMLAELLRQHQELRRACEDAKPYVEQRGELRGGPERRASIAAQLERAITRTKET